LASREDLKRLIEALKNAKDSIVRAKAVKALGNIRDLRVVEPLIQALKDEHWDVRRRAAWVLGNMGEPAVEPLLQALEDEHWDVRRKAAWALGNIRDARAIEPLIQALRDEYPDVRRQAARSLAALTVLSEGIAKSMIHDYELNLEAQDRASFKKSKKIYEQELKKLQD